MFKYSELKKFLQKAQSITTIYSFPNLLENKTGIILRHDVDVSVDNAYEMAQLNYDLGIKSSFLFLTSCPFYNINSRRNRKLISTMAEQGFDIGLHFDPTVYDYEQPEELIEHVNREGTSISQITSKKVNTISLHMPSVHGTYPLFEGYYNAYDPLYFQPDSYMSDSCMTFRDKKPVEFILQAKERLLQILLHPFHYSKDGDNYRELFKRLLIQQAETIDAGFRLFNENYVNDLEGKKLFELLS